MLNAAPAQQPIDGLLASTDILVVNETEASVLSGLPLDRDGAITTVTSVAHSLQQQPDQVVVITLGARGAAAVCGDDVFVIEGHTVDVVDTTGAGDCFVGYLAASLDAGQSLESAMDLANRAGAVCVQALGAGTSMPLRAAVDAAGFGRHPVAS